MARAPAKTKEIELEPDAWERFERAVDVVVRSPPRHRTKDDKAKAKRAKSPDAGKRKNRGAPRDKSRSPA